MKRIEPIKIKIRPASERGIFHDSREDVRRLAQTVNMLIDKQNEIIHMVNELIINKKPEGN